MAGHRYLLTHHPEGRETVQVYSATEIGRDFTAEEVARLALGKPVFRDGKRITDMQVATNLWLAAPKSPAPSLLRRALGALS
jgi:hypothetical protein